MLRESKDVSLLTRVVDRYRCLDSVSESELGRRAQAGERRAIELLVVHNLRLVLRTARRFRWSGVDRADLIDEGMIGLLRAAHGWRQEHDARFATYALKWIRAQMLQFVLHNRRLVQVGNTRAGRRLFFRIEKELQKLRGQGFEPTPRLLAERLGVAEQEVEGLMPHLLDGEAPVDDLPLACCETPEEVVSALEIYGALARAKEEFERTLQDDREKAIWSSVVVAEDPTPLLEVGTKFGISKQRVGQIAERLKERFRNHLLPLALDDISRGAR